MQFCKTGEKARLFDDVYYAAKTWAQPRRLVMKAEWLPKGGNPRFVLTNMELPPQELYDHFYVCLLYTSPSPRDLSTSRMPSSA